MFNLKLKISINLLSILSQLIIIPYPTKPNSFFNVNYNELEKIEDKFYQITDLRHYKDTFGTNNEIMYGEKLLSKDLIFSKSEIELTIEAIEQYVVEAGNELETLTGGSIDVVNQILAILKQT
jgi:hypothetical protein